MKIVFAPDSFKDSLSAARVAHIIRNKAEEIFPKCEMREVPLANGDKGTVETLVSVLGGKYETLVTIDCMGEEKEMIYGVLDDQTVILEAGQILRASEQDAHSMRQKLLFSSSFGLGKAILQLLDRGYRKMYIGAGTGTTFDGGMGCVGALGVKFYNKKGELLEPAGVNLMEVDKIDTRDLDSRMRETDLIVMCAVNNMLLGVDGATYVYGAQNGGGPDELLRLEHGMRKYADCMEETTGIIVRNAIGGGAAGGLPVSLMAIAGAKLQSGISTVLKLMNFEEIIEEASMVVVGEGMFDKTSIYGKALTGIGMLCKSKGVPVVALVGRVGFDAKILYEFGISSVVSSVEAIMDEGEAIEDAEKHLSYAAEKMFRLLAVGIQIQAREDVLHTSGMVLRHEKYEEA